jgi:hypothetical protein
VSRAEPFVWQGAERKGGRRIRGSGVGTTGPKKVKKVLDMFGKMDIIKV